MVPVLGRQPCLSGQTLQRAGVSDRDPGLREAWAYDSKSDALLCDVGYRKHASKMKRGEGIRGRLVRGRHGYLLYFFDGLLKSILGMMKRMFGMASA